MRREHHSMTCLISLPSSGTSWSSGTELRTTLHSPIDPADLTSLRVTLHGQGAGVRPPLLPTGLRVKRVNTQLVVTAEDLCTETERLEDKETMVFRPCGEEESEVTRQVDS